MSFLDHPQKQQWRKALFQLHLWTGVLLAIYVLAISISGSILVFQRELTNDTPALADNCAPSSINYDEIISIATRAHTDLRFESIDLRTERRRIVPVILTGARDERTVYVDSMTRQTLRDVATRDAHPVVRFMLSLHTELLTRRSGAIANGIGGLVLFVLCITGVILWWPGRRRWKQSLTVCSHASWVRINWDLHSAVGFWSILFVAMWGATGAYFIWPQAVRNAVARVSPMNHFQERPSTWTPGDLVLPANDLIARAQRRYPQSQLAYLFENLDTPGGGVVKVFLSSRPSRSLTLLEDVVTFQPATGEVLSDISTSNLTPVERISLALYSIHFGDFAGLPLKVAWCALGLVPSLLTITGLLMWWNRILKKKLTRAHTRQCSHYR